MAKATPINLVESQQSVSEEILKRQLNEAQSAMSQMQLRLEEQISGLDLMIENTGWSEVYGYAAEEGPNWREILAVSAQIRNLTALNAHMKRGLSLRQSYIWQDGIHYAKVPNTGRGRGTNVQALIDDPLNQKNFFSTQARFRREGALYTSGQAMYMGVDEGGSKSIVPVPVWTVGDHYLNPDDPSDVWAYRRTWTHFAQGGAGEERAEWVFAWEHRDKATQTKSITYSGKPEPVAQNKVMFTEDVNRQEGFMFGLPDALAAMQWARVYRDAILDGRKMTSALATIAFKLKAQTAKGANNAAAKTAASTEKGGTAAMVDGMDIAALATAGKAYEFDALRPLLSVMATALEVSVVALSSDPGAAGSSYGSAATLDMPTRLAMESRRMLHVDLDKKVLAWFGAPDADVWFEPLTDGAEIYREAQALLLPFINGLYKPQEMRDRTDDLFGWPRGTVPEGVLTPNNSASLPRRDIDTDGVGGAATTPAADQGQSNGVGGDGNNTGNSLRTDTVS